MRKVSQQFCFGCLVLMLMAAGRAPAQAAHSRLSVPANTYIEMVVTRPVWAATANAGDPLYLQTSSPVMVGTGVAIPAGSYVLAQIQKITRPTYRLPQAVLLVDFQKIIFANGYTVALNASGAQTTSVVTVSVTTANDLLLDNGTNMFTNLGSALALKTKQVQQAIALAKTPNFAMQSATKCVPDPGSPGTDGTPDITIPGTTWLPGTPDITSTNPDGTTSILIPGTPERESTPDTVIPGTPGSPGTPATVCPDPPHVTSSVLVSLAGATDDSAQSNK